MRRAARPCIVIQRGVLRRKMNLAQRVGANRNIMPLAQIRRQGFCDHFGRNRFQHGVNHFAQLLWAKVVELAIDGHAAADMDCCERRIALRIIALSLVAGWIIRKSLDLVRLIQTQRIRLATFVPLPLAEGNEAHAAGKSLRVTLDNPLRLVARQKRPDDDFPAGALAIGGRYLENEQTLFD